MEWKPFRLKNPRVIAKRLLAEPFDGDSFSMGQKTSGTDGLFRRYENRHGGWDYCAVADGATIPMVPGQWLVLSEDESLVLSHEEFMTRYELCTKHQDRDE